MRKNSNKKGKNTKSYDDEEKSYLISYFYDYCNSLGERRYYVKNELVYGVSKKDAYDYFHGLYPHYGIINIIPLDD